LFDVTNNIITLTRGDYAELDVFLYNQDKTPHILIEGETLTLSVKRKITDITPIFQKVLKQGDELVFVFLPEDTKNLDFGAYKYDVEFNTADGKPDTIITPHDFIIGEEVT
jgi:hypothetical protein